MKRTIRQPSLSIGVATRLYCCPPKTSFQPPSKHAAKHAALAALKKKQAGNVFWAYMGTPIAVLLFAVLYVTLVYYGFSDVLEKNGITWSRVRSSSPSLEAEKGWGRGGQGKEGTEGTEGAEGAEGRAGRAAVDRPGTWWKQTGNSRPESIKSQQFNAFDSDHINAFGRHGYTRLMVACEKGQYSEVERMLAVPGIDVNLRCKTMNLSAMYAAACHNYYNIVRLLLAVPSINVNLPGGDGSTVMHVAAERGHLQVMTDLLLRATDTIDINHMRHKDGATPMMIACQNGRYYVVECLLHFKVDLTLTSYDGTTAFFSACHSGNAKLVKLLLNYMKWRVNNNRGGEKGKIDETSLNAHSEGYTPFFTAVQDGHIDVVELLLNVSGVDIDKGRPGQAGVARWSPLDAARHGAEKFTSHPDLSRRYAGIVELLLAAGAIDYKNKKATVAKQKRQKRRRQKRQREDTEDWLDTEQFHARWKLIEAKKMESFDQIDQIDQFAFNNDSQSQKRKHAHGLVAKVAKGLVIPGSEVVAKVNDTWIHARVVRWHSRTKRYEVEDADIKYEVEDAGTESQTEKSDRYQVQPRHIISLVMPKLAETFEHGARVLALFPWTMSFYAATVVSKGFTHKPGDKYAKYGVRFDDDKEEGKIVKERKIPRYFVVRYRD